MFDQEYALVVYRHNWGEDRVYFHDRQGALCSLPASWTNAISPDPFVAIAAGRCPFRYQRLPQERLLLLDEQPDYDTSYMEDRRVAKDCMLS
ncbi:MAG: Y4bD/Y4pK family protein [Acidobacteriia bacterium]|nr:Y4bD/Y4pK family protein [Terriglobia bacterium]